MREAARRGPSEPGPGAAGPPSRHSGVPEPRRVAGRGRVAVVALTMRFADAFLSISTYLVGHGVGGPAENGAGRASRAAVSAGWKEYKGIPGFLTVTLSLNAAP